MKRFKSIAIILMAMWWTGIEGVYHTRSAKIVSPAIPIPSDSLFGFSISILSKDYDKRLIVSAPSQDSVGKVYDCKGNNYYCTEIISPKIKEKPITNMWLGASVAAGNNFTVACAPRAVTVSTNQSISKTGTYGRCYVQTADGSVTQLNSLSIEDKKKVNSRLNLECYMDTFGWALDVDRLNSITVGGPGMYKGRAIRYSNVTAKPKSQRFPNDIKYNFGYSVTSGYFINLKTLLYAVSSPYGKSGEGMVLLSLSNHGPTNWPLLGAMEYVPPVGSLFGASLCAAKLRGPGQREALLVGASLYPAKGGVDVGAVYIYQYDPAKSDADWQYQVVHQKTILGTGDRGQFGSAIVNLGDINGDKRDDVAISAPYENEGRGTVYIYSAADILGDDPADRVRYLQKLQPGYSSFGLSLAAPKFSKKSCEVLAVGAPMENTVLVYSCIPKIIVRVLKLKAMPRIRKTNTFFQYQSCVDINYPDDLITVRADIDVKVTLIHPTAMIESAQKDGSFSYTIYAGTKKKEQCRLLNIVLPEEGSSPQIQYQVSATQRDPPTNDVEFDSTHVLLSDVSTLTLTDTLWVADCDSNKCVPILTVDIGTSLRDGYIIGSTESESVSVSVRNTGDPAYTACVRVSVGQARVRRWPRACTRTAPGAATCAPDRPVRNQTSWNTGDIKLEMNTLRSDVKELVFTANLFEECYPEITVRYLHASKRISLKTDSKGLAVREYTNFGDIIHLSQNEISETGKQVSHIYTVYNRGFTTWINIGCDSALDKKIFFQEMVVTLDAQATYKCDVGNDTNGKYTSNCIVSELKSEQKFDVIVSIYVQPGSIDWESLETDNITVTSYFKLSFGEKSADYSITSILRKKDVLIPLWIVVVAALVGLLILFLIAFALYECGFLKREKKEELKKLRRSVYRQSMRRSAMERESRRSANKDMDPQSDVKKLIEESEDSEPPSPSTVAKPALIQEVKKSPMAGENKPSIAGENKPPMAGENRTVMAGENKQPMADVEKPSMKEEKKPPVATKPEVDPVKKPPRAAIETPPPQTIPEESSKEEPSVPSQSTPADGVKMKKELIILGLQKNLGRYPYKPPKAKTQESSSEIPEDQETQKQENNC